VQRAALPHDNKFTTAASDAVFPADARLCMSLSPYMLAAIVILVFAAAIRVA
jgi:hypothetical protein